MTESVEEFLSRGGKIQNVEEGERSSFAPDHLKDCSCGCEGDYTDHQMRKGENGLV